MDYPFVENLRLSATAFLSCLTLLMPAFSHLIKSTILTKRRLFHRSFHYQALKALPQLQYVVKDPLHFKKLITLLVSCYAFFKRWSLPNPLPSSQRNQHSFYTSQHLRTLACDLGFFPHDYRFYHQ